MGLGVWTGIDRRDERRGASGSGRGSPSGIATGRGIEGYPSCKGTPRSGDVGGRTNERRGLCWRRQRTHPAASVGGVEIRVRRPRRWCAATRRSPTSPNSPGGRNSARWVRPCAPRRPGVEKVRGELRPDRGSPVGPDTPPSGSWCRCCWACGCGCGARCACEHGAAWPGVRTPLGSLRSGGPGRPPKTPLFRPLSTSWAAAGSRPRAA